MTEKPTYEELEQRIKEFEKEVAKFKSIEEGFKRERNIFLGGPIVVFKWSVKENWPTGYVSPNVAQFGYQAEDFMNSRIFYIDIIYPEDREKIMSEVQEHSESDVAFYEQEYRIIQANGEIKWVYDFRVVGRNDKNEITHYDGYILDITGRKKIEEGLRESEKYYRAIFDQAGFGIALIDAETGKMIDFNTKAHESHGYTREEYMTLTPIDIDTIDNSMIATDRAKRIVEKGSEIFETKHRTKKGKIIDILTSSVPIYLNGRNYLLNISHDITSRVQAELGLLKSEEFNSSLLESSPNPIQVVNPDISIRYVNLAFEELTGFDSKEILEKKAPFPWWIDDPRSGNTQGRKARIFKKERGIELLFRKKNGELFWVEISNTPIKRNGEITYILTNWIDITKRKQAEEALRQTHGELEQRVKERTKELELQKSRLEEVNTALNVLLKKRDEDKLMMEEKVMFNVKSLIEPMIGNLKSSSLDKNQTALVETLEFFFKRNCIPFFSDSSHQIPGIDTL